MKTDEDGGPVRVELADRDRQLLLALAEARLLSSEQLESLFFGGRARRVWRRRLSKLRDAEWLVEREVASSDGVLTMWQLGRAAVGHLENQGVACVGVDADLQPDYFEHHQLFTELYVRLLAGRVAAPAPATKNPAARRRALEGVYARAYHPEWRWLVAAESTALPWKMVVDGVTRDKLIRPDAILEVPAKRLRVFIEGETGTQSIVSAKKPGATTSKASAYDTYFTDIGDIAKRRTWYQQRWPDGWAAEVLVVVPSEGRALKVRDALEVWRKATTSKLVVRAFTVEQAVAHYAGVAGVPTAAPQRSTSDAAPDELPTGKTALPRLPPGHVLLTPEEASAVRDFYASTRADLKERQEAARIRQAQSPGVKVPMPVVPARYEAVKALVARLAGAQ